MTAGSARCLLATAGIGRGLVNIFGLLALSRVNVSFSEAVKSTTPLFTVALSWLCLGERTSATVQCSLVPVVAGLLLAAGSEAQFSALGEQVELEANANRK
jgi:solute carrier family 35 protein E1